MNQHSSAPASRKRRARPAATYEFRTLTIDRSITRSEARQLLSDEAEYGKWELARTRLYLGGKRVVTLRRRIIRVPSTLEMG